ncbi:MAG: hypothetical protein EA339_10575 [Rhodobacteraceae bacterium]|nr:MAG: hypothetical protein EA339_10575 [Paracoccaceae bacterium]
MHQEQQRSDASTAQKARKDCAIYALAMLSLRTVERAQAPHWSFVIRPVTPDTAEHMAFTD